MADGIIKGSDLFQDDGFLKDFEQRVRKIAGAMNEVSTAAKNVNTSTSTGKAQLGQYDQQMKTLIDDFFKGKKTLEEYRDAMTVVANTYTSATGKQEALRAATQKMNAIRKAEMKRVLSAKGSYNQLSAQYTLNKIKLNAMSKAERFATVEGRKLEKQTKKLYLEMDRLQKRTGKATLSVGKYGRAFSGILAGAGIVGGVAAIGRVILDASKSVIRFSAAQSNLAAILGRTKDNMKELTDSALIYGLTTKYTAAQVTDLQTNLAKLGFDEREILLSTKPIINFATALDINVAEAAKTAGSALRSFGYDASQMERVLSTLGVSTTKSAIQFSDFDLMISNVGPVAKAAGLTIEQLTGLFGRLKDSGFEASKASIGLRNIILKLSDANSDLFKKTGGLTNGFDGFIAKLKEMETDGTSLNEMLELTNVRSVAAFAALVTGTEDVKDLEDAVTDANGALEEMVDTQMDNLKGDLILLKSAWNGFILSLEDGTGPLARASRGITNLGRNILLTISNLDIAFTKDSNLTGEQISRNYDVFLAASGRKYENFTKFVNDLSSKSFEESVKGYDKFRTMMIGNFKASDDIVNKFWNEYLIRRTKQRNVEIQAEKDREKDEFIRQARELEAKLEAEAKVAEEERKIFFEKWKLRIDAMEDGLNKELELQDYNFTKKKDKWLELGLNIQDLVEWNEKKIEEITENHREDQLKDQADYNKKIIQQRKEALKLETDEYVASIQKLKIQAAEYRQQKLDQVLIDKWYNEEVKKLNKERFDKLYEEDLKLLDLKQEIELAKFQSQKRTKEELDRFEIESEIKKLQTIYAMNISFYRKMTDEEMELLAAQIAQLGFELENLGGDKGIGKKLLEKLGLGEEDIEAVSTAFDQATKALTNYFDKRKEVADEMYEIRKNEREAAQEALDEERKRNEEGYASNLEKARKDLDLAKEKEAKALEEKKKAQKAQLRMDAAAQASSLVTATANIWKSHTELGPFGIAAAIAGTAIMWGAFFSAQAKAMSATKKYRTGGYELIRGGSHYMGDDVPIGNNMVAQGGESHAVFNRSAVTKYGTLLPDLVASINKGTYQKTKGNVKPKKQLFVLPATKNFMVIDEDGRVKKLITDETIPG